MAQLSPERNCQQGMEMEEHSGLVEFTGLAFGLRKGIIVGTGAV
jgi:hypothetical protein